MSANNEKKSEESKANSQTKSMKDLIKDGDSSDK
jgi:hypothetical protein